MTLVDAIKKSKGMLVVGHQRPDGDCLGAGLALLRIADNLGVKADIVCDSDVSDEFSFMLGFDRINKKTTDSYDLLVVVDCGDVYRMGRFYGYLSKIPETVNIDHHKTNERYAGVNVVRAEASSTCEIVFDLLKDSDCIDKEAASLLFVGLSTDTGHFRHSNTSGKVFSVAEKLVLLGADPHAVAMNVYENVTIRKTKLTATAIRSMRFFRDDKICLISLSGEDLDDLGCTISDTRGLIDYAMAIGSVGVGICLTECDRTRYKVSFRSKKTDVAAAAAVFGGGGHTLAAGCEIFGTYEDVVSRLLKAVESVIKE